MKNRIFLIAGFLILSSSGLLTAKLQETNGNLPKEGTINISSTPDLFNLVVKWTSEYKKSNPNAKIEVTSFPVSSMNDRQLEGNGLRLISTEYYDKLNTDQDWSMTVGRDAVIPIINTSNPQLYTIRENGIAPEKLALAITNPAKQNWGTLLGNSNNLPLNVYIPYDNHVGDMVAGFLGVPHAKMNFITVPTDKDLVPAVQNDPNGIGFTKMINIFESSEQSFPENIILLPIDKNANGKLDYSEKIYDNWQSFLRGVWIGKYPHALCQNIFVVSAERPQNKAEVDFLSWIVTSGQIYLNDYGYFDLVNSDRQNSLDKLSPKEVAVIAPASGNLVVKIALVTLAALFFIGLAVAILLGYLRARRKSLASLKPVQGGVLDKESVKVLDGLYFDRSHTWSFMEKNGQVRVGIDDFLQHVTGNLTCVKMKKAGDKVSKGEIFLSIIQDGKRLNIKSPVSGVVMDHNDILILNSGLINNSPYNEGWIYMIEPTNWLKDIQSLIMADRYRVWISNEIARLKDFLAVTIRSHKLELSGIALQDGGPLHDNVLASLGPEVWDDFQTNFLDTAI